MKKLSLISCTTILATMLISCTHFQKLGWVFSSNPTPQNADSIQRGLAVYKTNCLMCHGATAKGDGSDVAKLKTRPSDLTLVANQKKDNIFAARVAYGVSTSDEMPKFSNKLTDQQIWDVTNYVYSLK